MKITKSNTGWFFEKRGLTLIEIIITMLIVSVLIATVLISLSGTLPRYRLSRGIRQVFNQMLVAKSKAVSLNRTYRINVLDSTSFKLQWDDGGTWTDDGGITSLPTDVAIMENPTDYVANCGTNLEFTPRGMINVLNGASIAPFIILENVDTGEQKGIEVNVGGNIKVQN